MGKHSLLIFHIDKHDTPQKFEKSDSGLCSSFVRGIIIPIRDARAARNWIRIRLWIRERNRGGWVGG